MTLSATILIEDDETGDMYRYDGGAWIQRCGHGISNSWEDTIFVWDANEGQSSIDMDIHSVAVAILTWMYESSEEGEA